MTLWQDVLISRPVEDDELTRAFALALGVLPGTVRVVDDMLDAPSVGNRGVHVVVDRTRVLGDFPLLLGVYVRDTDALERLEQEDEAVAAVARLCALLECSALISDDSPSVLTGVRVSSSGDLDAVTLDEDHLDRDEYVVASARRLERRATPAA